MKARCTCDACIQELLISLCVLVCVCVCGCVFCRVLYDFFVGLLIYSTFFLAFCSSSSSSAPLRARSLSPQTRHDPVVVVLFCVFLLFEVRVLRKQPTQLAI
jgi:hypothetical protein